MDIELKEAVVDYSKISDNLIFQFQMKFLKPQEIIDMNLPYMRLKGSQTVIMYVLINFGTFTMGNLARTVGISEKSIAHPVQMLEKWDYVITFRDPKDLRRNLIKVTEQRDYYVIDELKKLGMEFIENYELYRV